MLSLTVHKRYRQFEFTSVRQSVLIFGILQRNERKIVAFAGLREIL